MFARREPLLELFVHESALRVEDARTLLAKFDLGADHVLRAAQSLSPGERTRASLALLSARGVNCLVLDEPTNHLDVEAIERLEPLGVRVELIACVPDDIEVIAELVRERAPRSDVVLVTGGLGGTPDDLTREALAHAFGVPQSEVPEVAAALRARFTRDPEYAARWALLPQGARPP